MTSGGARGVIRLRQSKPKWNWRAGLVAFATLAYTFAGFGAYWLRTGSWTVGEGGTVSNLGGLIWFLPAVAFAVVIVVINDRGPFTALYDARTTVVVGPDGLEWWTAKAGEGRLVWSCFGSVSRIRAQDTRAREGTRESVFELSGKEVVAFEGPFKVEGRRKSVSLPTIIFEARPDLVAPTDPRHPERGCVRRSASGSTSSPLPG
jgi:hypothetical protein